MTNISPGLLLRRYSIALIHIRRMYGMPKPEEKFRKKLSQLRLLLKGHNSNNHGSFDFFKNWKKKIILKGRNINQFWSLKQKKYFTTRNISFLLFYIYIEKQDNKPLNNPTYHNNRWPIFFVLQGDRLLVHFSACLKDGTIKFVVISNVHGSYLNHLGALMITYIAIVNNLCVCYNRVTCQGYVGICSCHLSVIIKVQMNPSLLKKKTQQKRIL